jgi:hypothetical protein
MADSKGGTKNRKYGRHSRAPSNKLQPQRTEKNRRLRVERDKRRRSRHVAHLAKRAANPEVQRRLAATRRARTLRRIATAESILKANPSWSEVAGRIANLRANLMVG